MSEWLPWIGASIGALVGAGIVLIGYLFGEKRGWWW